jgi:hypothetical protein
LGPCRSGCGHSLQYPAIRVIRKFEITYNFIGTAWLGGDPKSVAAAQMAGKRAGGWLFTVFGVDNNGLKGNRGNAGVTLLCS